MIASLTGKVLSIDETFLIVDTQGVGYAVSVTKPEAYSMGETYTLQTYMHWNQENGPSLFGFVTAAERSVFTLLMGCSGLGPKIAMSILSQVAAHDVISIIALADVKALSSLHGIGPKKAESIVLQLRDKVGRLKLSAAEGATSQSLANLKHVSDVLSSLNYSRPEITAALEHVKQMPTWQEAPMDLLVRKALTYFTKQN